MGWEQTFPGYAVPDELQALIRSGKLVDESWSNDACVRLVIAGEDVPLWVDHPDPDRRETGGKRFTVVLTNEDGETAVAVETDRLPELLHYLDDHWGIN